MGLKEIYAKVEDKWYGFVEWLDKRNVPLYKAVDALEAKNIPSLPVFFILFLLIIGGIIFLASGMLVQTTSLKVLVTDSGYAPLAGVTVSVSAETYAQEQLTDDLGTAQFENVPLNKELTVSANKGQFTAKEEKITLSEKGELSLALEKILNKFDRTISFVGAEGELIEETPFVSFSCSNSNANYSETVSIENGEVTLKDIPENCGQLIIENIVGFTPTESTIELSASAPQIELQKESTVGKGNVTVNVKDSEGNAVFDVIVLVMHADDTLEQQLETPASGTILFDSVPADDYYILVSSNGDYEEYKSDTKAVNANAGTKFDITLTKSAAGKIKIQVLNKDSKAVKNAKVKLLSNGIFVKESLTNDEGKTEFTVSVNTTYGLEIDHPDYLIYTEKGVAPKETYYTYVLTTLTSENAQSIEVVVVDGSENPVESTTVALRNADGTPVGDQQTTGADGKTEFMNVQVGEYYVYAVKEGFDGEVSENFNVEAKKTSKVTISLNIGSGLLNLNLVDEDKNPLQGAQIKALNLADGKLLKEGTTDAQGKTNFSIRADKKVYFIIETSKYLPYVTLPYTPLVNSEQTINIDMVKDVATISAKFKGLTLNEETVQNSVNSGKRYTALLQLYVPAETNYDKVALHFRVGNEDEGKTNLMEEDSLFIRKVISSATKVKKGTTYSPSTNMSTDYANFTAGDAKWAELVWDLGGAMPKSGVFNAAVEIEIRDEAAQGDVVYAYYRGYAIKGNTFIRDPEDETLKTTETNALKQSLYAKAKAMPYSIGPSNLCSNNFCRQFEMEDVDAKLKTAIVDYYVGKITGVYKLNFKITKTSVKKYTDSTLKIANESGGLKIKEYTITTPAGKTIAKKLDSYTFEEELGTLGEGSLLTGTLTLETEKEGANLLDIKITADKEEIFSYSITTEVEAAKEMFLDMLPKAVVPYIDNKLLFRVTDKDTNPIVNAFVNVELDAVILKSGTTDNAGILALELEAPKLGSVLRITAKKNSFKSVVKEVMVTSDLLLVNPIDLTLEMTPSTGAQIALPLVMRNLTYVPFKVKSISVSKDLTPYVKVKGSDFINTLIDLNTDYNGTITFELTDAGKLTEQTITSAGTISIVVSNPDLGKEWLIQLPLQFRVVLGLETDTANCLGLLNKKGEATKEMTIVTTKYKAAAELVLKNACSVSNNPVLLKNLTVKIKELEEKQPLAIGEFRIKSEKMQNIVLTDGTKAVAMEVIDKSSENPFTIEFTPNQEAKSTSQTATLVFEATHLTANGEEKIKLEYTVKIVISYLEECVKIVKPDYMELFTCANNTGLGMFPGYFGAGLGMNQGYQNTYMNPSGIGSTTLGSQNYPQNMQGNYGLYSQPSYPNTGYNGMNPMTTGYEMGMDSFGAGAYGNTNWICDQTADAGKFKIVNSCDIPVEIKIEPSSQLQVKENAVTLEPKQEKEVVVAPGIFSGVYPITVSGKWAGSQTDSLELNKFNVTVMRLGDIQDRCRPTMNPTTFNVGFIGWVETKGKIYNNCYNMGYRLMQFGPQNISCYTITQAESQMVQQAGQVPTGYPQSPTQTPQMSQFGACDLVRYLVSSPPRVEAGMQGMSEVIEFSIRYDPQIIEQYPGFVPGTMNEQFGNLRIAANRQAKSIVSPGQAIVSYMSPFAMQVVSEVIPITLMDYWQFSGTADIIMKNGNPSTKPEECIPTKNQKDFFNMDKKFGILSDTHFTQDRFVYDNGGDVRGHTLMRIAYDRHEVLEKKLPVCGEGDFINDLEKTQITSPTGLTVYFQKAYSNHSIVMIIDRSEMETECAKIDDKIPVRVTRIYYGGTSPVIYIPIKMRVLNTGVKEKGIDWSKCENNKVAKKPETPEEKEVGQIRVNIEIECKAECTTIECNQKCIDEKWEGCELCKNCPTCGKPCIGCKPGEGEEGGKGTSGKTPLFCAGNADAQTGEDAYTRYGFDKYLLTWKKEDITENTCKEKFCDGAQFVLSLMKLSETAKEAIGKISPTIISEVCGKDRIDCTKITTLKKLYVFTKEPVWIRDETNGLYYLYFLSKTGNNLLDMKLPAGKTSCEDVVKTTKNKIKEAHDKGSFSLLGDVLNNFDKELQDCYAKKDIDRRNVVIEFEAKSKNLATSGTIANLFFNMVFDKSEKTGKYYMTFKEYEYLHSMLIDQTDASTGKGNCKDADTCKFTYEKPKDTEATSGDIANEISGKSSKWIEFLQFLLKYGNFKVIYVYKETNSESTDEYIIDHAKDRDSLSSDFLKAKLNYLIGDAFYVADFKADFNAVYGLDTSAWKYMRATNPKTYDLVLPLEYDVVDGAAVWVETSKEAIAPGKNSGLYFVSYEPSIAINGTAITLGTNTTVKLILAKDLNAIDAFAKTAYNDNVFLKLPLDGRMGSDSETEADLANLSRDGYGYTFAPLSPDTYDAILYAQNTGLQDLTAVSPTSIRFPMKGKGTGNIGLSAFAGKQYADTVNGLLMDLTKKTDTGYELQYNPSIPTAIKLETKDSGSTSVYYRFSNKNEAFKKGDYGTPTPESLIAYINTGKKKVTDSLGEKEKPSSFKCDDWTSGSKFIANIDVSSTDAPLLGMIYTPDSYFSGKLEVLCAEKAIKISAKSFPAKQAEETSWVTSTEGGTVNLKTSGGQAVKALSGYIDGIKLSNICVLGKDDSTKLYWNGENYLLNK